MRRSRGRVVRVESLADFDRRVEAGATRLSGWRVARVDLRDRGEALTRLHVAGATFLGCTFGPGVEESIEGAGALVLPPLTVAPVDVYRSTLYTAEELYDATPYLRSLDGRAYAWSQTRGNAAWPPITPTRCLRWIHAVSASSIAWSCNERASASSALPRVWDQA